MIVMTVVCVVSGYWLNRAFRQRDAVRRFNQLAADRGGDTPVTMLYHHKGDVHWAPIIPEWLHPVRDLVGSEAFGNPIGVQLVRTAATDDDLRYLKDVPKVEWVANRTNSIELDVSAVEPSILVLSQIDYPGWKATVDGRVVPLTRANYAFPAIFISRGTHHVRFFFEPLTFKLGLAFSVLAAAILTAMIFRTKK